MEQYGPNSTAPLTHLTHLASPALHYGTGRSEGLGLYLLFMKLKINLYPSFNYLPVKMSSASLVSLVRLFFFPTSRCYFSSYFGTKWYYTVLLKSSMLLSFGISLDQWFTIFINAEVAKPRFYGNISCLSSSLWKVTFISSPIWAFTHIHIPKTFTEVLVGA